MRGSLPLVAIAVALALVVTMASAEARACDPVIPAVPVAPPPDDTHAHWGIAYAVVGGVDVAFATLDLALHEQGFPAWLGMIELSLGITQSAFAGVLLAGLVSSYGSCGGSHLDHLAVGSSLLVATGGWLITHGILSMSIARADRLEVAPSVAIGPDGAVLSVVGTF